MDDARINLTAAVCLGRGDDIARLAKEASALEKQKALAAAAYNGRLEVIDIAIGLGADPNAANIGPNHHATALHNAVCSGSPRGGAETRRGRSQSRRQGWAVPGDAARMDLSILFGRKTLVRLSTCSARAPGRCSMWKSPRIFAARRVPHRRVPRTRMKRCGLVQNCYDSRSSLTA